MTSGNVCSANFDHLIPLENIIVDLRAMDGTWCSHPYAGHPHGCPNFLKGCTNRPYFNHPTKGIGNHYQKWFAVVEEFDLDAHAEKMRLNHPEHIKNGKVIPAWTERQCRNPLYWQSGVRKRLKEKAFRLHPALKEWGNLYTPIPESWGIDVFETMKLVGVVLERKPGIVRKVAFIGVHS